MTPNNHTTTHTRDTNSSCATHDRATIRTASNGAAAEAADRGNQQSAATARCWFDRYFAWLDRGKRALLVLWIVVGAVGAGVGPGFFKYTSASGGEERETAQQRRQRRADECAAETHCRIHCHSYGLSVQVLWLVRWCTKPTINTRRTFPMRPPPLRSSSSFNDPRQMQPPPPQQQPHPPPILHNFSPLMTARC